MLRSLDLHVFMSADSVLKKGYIKDFISGQSVKHTPEKLNAVQLFSKQLVEDYNYKDSYTNTPSI